MMSYKHLLVASLATLMLLPACGNNNDNGSTPPPTGNSLTCGEGTRRMAGECVPISDLATCGQGTMLVDGECVATETGGNNDVTCGAGTTNVDGKCVPDAMNVCGQGTMLDEATGRCVATACDELRIKAHFSSLYKFPLKASIPAPNHLAMLYL